MTAQENEPDSLSGSHSLPCKLIQYGGHSPQSHFHGEVPVDSNDQGRENFRSPPTKFLYQVWHIIQKEA